MSEKAITFCIMDPPYENERTVTLFRILDALINRGIAVNVFAYEGAVSLSFKHQKPHGNDIHGHNIEEEQHPLTREWIASLKHRADQKSIGFNWINCGLCVDERGVNDTLDFCKRGGPMDMWKLSMSSLNSVVIGTR